MSNTVNEIARLQAEYDALESQGAERFGTKARLILEKQLREEMKKKLDAIGGDEQSFKQKKGEAFRALHAAKAQRRQEIEAAVADGSVSPDAAEAEIIALGWEPGVAKAAVATALKLASGAIETLAAPPEPEPAIPEEIMDPAGAAQPVVRKEVYAEPGRTEPTDEKRRPQRGNKR